MEACGWCVRGTSSAVRGLTIYGNRAAGVTLKCADRRRMVLAHEEAVRGYALWLSKDEPEQRSLREHMRSRLRGRRLVCHCAGQGLPCHAEVIAVVANACVSCEVLAAGGRG